MQLGVLIAAAGVFLAHGIAGRPSRTGGVPKSTGGCPHSGWATHQLEVVDAPSTSVINRTNLADSFFGIEGGHMLQVGSHLYTVITEFNAPPLWVPSRIAMWRAPFAAGDVWPGNWERLGTLFTSGGTCDCKSFRASLGSSAALAYNNQTGHYEVFYVGFKSCNDSSFVNRNGRIFRAVAAVPGEAGLSGTFQDVDVVISPDRGMQPWEGLQGDDSLQPYSLGDGRGWAGFYGSAGVTASGVNPGQHVGLAFAPTLAGPWVRAVATNPVNLSTWVSHIEQPMVTQLRDGSFVAVFDALSAQGRGMIGYSWSPDGIQWHPECSQLLDVLKSPAATWAHTNVTRTPQGLVELQGSDLLLGFSAYDFVLNYTSKYGGNKHESMGLARVRFQQ